MRHSALAFVLTILIASPGWAQTTGSINGTITDNTQAFVPGVTVTATSPALMGTQTAVSNTSGEYRFPALPPGTYRLSFTLPGFATVVRDGIVVGLGFTATVHVQMTVATVQETVTVEGLSPTVDVTSTNIQTNFTAEMLKDIPNARDIWTLIGQAPGMMVTSFDVGGSRAGTQTGFSAFGYGGQVRVQIDGVNTTEGTGAAGFYYDFGSFAEVQLSTDAHDAQAPTPGVQLNAVLKSGGNDFRGNLYFDYENQRLQGRNVTDALRRVGVGEGTRILSYRDPNVDFGGPIARDKFWFYTSIRDQRTGVVVNGFPADNPSDFEFETRLTNISYKLTWQLNASNRLGHYIQLGRKFQPHRGAGSTTYQDAVFRQDSWSWAANVDWHSVPGSNFFFDVRYATFGYDWPNLSYGLNGEISKPGEALTPGGGYRHRMSDNASGNTAGADAPDETNRLRHQADVTGNWFKDDWFYGDHSMKFGLTSEWEQLEDIDYGFLDHYSLTFNSTNSRPDFTVPLRVTLRNTPRRAVNATWHHGVFLNDQWRLRRGLTANVGVRLDYYSSYYPDQEIWDGPFRDFFYSGAPLSNGYSIAPSAYAGTFVIPGQSGFRRHVSVGPRLGLTWDPWGQGKTVFKVNWGRYYFNTGTASSTVNPAQSITYTFNWVDNGDRQFTLNELGSFNSSSGGTTQLIDPNIKHGYTDSTSLWLEHELFRNVALRVGYTYRSDGNNSQAVELQRTYDKYTGLVMAADPGPDGTAGNADDGPDFPVYDIPSALLLPSRTETRTVGGFIVVDRAFDIALSKRMSSNWSMTTSFLYNWDRDRGRPQNPNQERFNDATVTLWSAKFYMTYLAPWGIVVTPVLRHQSGDQLSRNVQVTRGIDAVTGLQRNITTGTFTYEAEGPTAYREDSITIFDTRIEKQFNIGGHRQLSVFMDAFNINNTNASQSADGTVGRRTVTVDGEVVNYQRFLRPTGVLPPRIFRFGFKLGF